MVVVACSGFPVPVSRYWQEFAAVEISETEIGIPGQGTVRRWLRESPDNFVFTLLAPKSIVADGFKQTPETANLVKEIGNLCRSMKALAVVFVAPPEFGPTRPNKAAVKAFVESLPARYPRAIVDLPGWTLDQAESAVDRKGVQLAYDPLREAPKPEKTDLVYIRLPGPAGHRSRYDEGSLELIVAHTKTLKAKQTLLVFHNIDMHANAKRVREMLGQLK